MFISSFTAASKEITIVDEEEQEEVTEQPTAKESLPESKEPDESPVSASLN